VQETRKSIHELANSLAVADASVSRLMGLLSKHHPELQEEILLLKKADDYLKKSVSHFRDLRSNLDKET
jgi:hypothetical protein